MGCHVVELAAAGERATQGVPIPQVPVRLFHLEPAQVPEVAVGPDQNPHLHAGGKQPAHDRCSDEPGRAGHKGLHR